jgi:hypothetical protein
MFPPITWTFPLFGRPETREPCQSIAQLSASSSIIINLLLSLPSLAADTKKLEDWCERCHQHLLPLQIPPPPPPPSSSPRLPNSLSPPTSPSNHPNTSTNSPPNTSSQNTFPKPPKQSFLSSAVQIESVNKKLGDCISSSSTMRSNCQRTRGGRCGDVRRGKGKFRELGNQSCGMSYSRR